MMKVNITIIMLLSLISCNNKKDLVLLPLHPYIRDFNEDISKTRDVYFVVKNFDFAGKGNYEKLQAFAVNYKQSDTCKCQLYSVIFYSYSSVTNEEYRETESDLLDWHSKDLLSIIGWEKNRLMFIQKFQHGKLIDTSNVNLKYLRADTLK